MKNFVFIVFIISIFTSCEGDYDIRYEWRGMTAHNADNSTFIPSLNTSDSIKASTYVLRLEMNTVELSREGRYLDEETPPVNINPLDSLNIRSSFDFDSTYLAGENLSDHFLILNGSYFHTIPANGSEGYPLTNVYSRDFEKIPNVKTIDLLLTSTPTLSRNHLFIVEFILNDGTTFLDTTSAVTLY